MALLRNLEQSLSGLFEGTFGRVFRTEVRPTEIARKLAREMEINKRVSLSRTYAPTDYLVYLSSEDRGRYAGVEQSIAEELGAYLLEHARRERLVLVRRPLVEFRTDGRLRLGEFGIEARTAPISAEEAPPRDGAEPAHRPTARDHGAADAGGAARSLYDANDPDPELRPSPPAPEPAVPLGSIPGDHDDDIAPPSLDPVEEDAPYDDPYANDFGGGQDSAEYEWVDAPARDRAPEPLDDDHEPEPHVVEAAHGSDWLDPVEDWDPEAAAAPLAPEPEAPLEPEAHLPQAPEPHVPAEAPRQVAPHPPHPEPDPLAGAPWIDPTLQRQKRPPLAPPVIAAAPQRVEPRVPDTVLLVDGTPHELHGDRMVLGRSRSADIVISDASISRQHLELRRDDRGWYAVDLGSTNGSQLGGTPLSEPRRLEPGQRIKLGHADAIIEVR